MQTANLILPVFAIILTGWVLGAVGYVPRSLSGPLVQFAYTIAMPALVFLTVAQEPLGKLINVRFILAFGGGSTVMFVAVFLGARLGMQKAIGSSAVIAAAASMTNTGFVALPILEALYGQRGVLSAAIATVFIAVVMLPLLIILLELDVYRSLDVRTDLIRQVCANPIVLATIAGLAWSASGAPLLPSLSSYTGIFAAALAPCALFSIGLGLTLEGLGRDLKSTTMLSALKLGVAPLLVYGLCLAVGLGRFDTTAAVVCAAVPTAKTAFVLASQYRVEKETVGSAVSMTTVASMASLLCWLFVLQ